MTPQKVFAKYKKDIEAVYRGQQDASTLVISAILEIGRVCLDAREYKNRLTLKDKDTLWGQFEKSLPISKSSISKYISIYQHPLIRLKKYSRNLPPSVFSLYELSKIKVNQFEKLIQSGKINSDIGRAELNLLLQGKSSSKRITQSANEVEVLSLRLPADSWEGKFGDIESELLEFLKQRGIGYVYGNEIQKRKRQESKFSRNLQKYIDSKLKKHCASLIKEYINYEARIKYSAASKKLSFKGKWKLLGFFQEEVDLGLCRDMDEVKDLLVSHSYLSELEWGQLTSRFFDEAFEKYPQPSYSAESNAKPVEFEKPALLMKQRRKIDKSKFDGIKV